MVSSISPAPPATPNNDDTVVAGPAAVASELPKKVGCNPVNGCICTPPNKDIKPAGKLTFTVTGVPAVIWAGNDKYCVTVIRLPTPRALVITEEVDGSTSTAPPGFVTDVSNPILTAELLA
jgi:hypothetical protein